MRQLYLCAYLLSHSSSDHSFVKKAIYKRRMPECDFYTLQWVPFLSPDNRERVTWNKTKEVDRKLINANFDIDLRLRLLLSAAGCSGRTLCRDTLALSDGRAGTNLSQRWTSLVLGCANCLLSGYEQSDDLFQTGFHHHPRHQRFVGTNCRWSS